MSSPDKMKSVETISWKKEFPPILEIPRAGNPIGYHMSYSDFSTYNPELSKEKLPIENPELKKVLERSYSEDTLNLRNTNPERVKTFTLQYLKKNPHLLHGIDLYNLTPKAAFELAGKIVAERLQYDHESTKIQISQNEKFEVIPTDVMVPSKFNGNRQYWKPDKGGEQFSAPQIRKIAERLQKTQVTPVEQLLAKERWAVCRHYSRTFNAIFDALKSIQKGSSLINTYAIETNSPGHSFNLGVTIESGKKLNMVSMDPTSADVEKQDEYDTKEGRKTRLGFDLARFDNGWLRSKDANRSFFQNLNFKAKDPDFALYSNNRSKYEEGVLYKDQLRELAQAGNLMKVTHSKIGEITIEQAIGKGEKTNSESLKKSIPQKIRDLVFGFK